MAGTMLASRIIDRLPKLVSMESGLDGRNNTPEAVWDIWEEVMSQWSPA